MSPSPSRPQMRRSCRRRSPHSWSTPQQPRRFSRAWSLAERPSRWSRSLRRQSSRSSRRQGLQHPPRCRHRSRHRRHRHHRRRRRRRRRHLLHRRCRLRRPSLCRRCRRHRRPRPALFLRRRRRRHLTRRRRRRLHCLRRLRLEWTHRRRLRSRISASIAGGDAGGVVGLARASAGLPAPAAGVVPIETSWHAATAAKGAETTIAARRLLAWHRRHPRPRRRCHHRRRRHLHLLLVHSLRHILRPRHVVRAGAQATRETGI